MPSAKKVTMWGCVRHSKTSPDLWNGIEARLELGIESFCSWIGRWRELLQSLCAGYLGRHPADDGIDESRNGQWQVSSVGVDDAHAEIATHVLGQHRSQSASGEIGRTEYRS